MNHPIMSVNVLMERNEFSSCPMPDAVNHPNPNQSTTMPTPKKKPATKPQKPALKVIPPMPDAVKAAAAAGEWKTSVDLTLARHGKEQNEHARRLDEHSDALVDHHEDIRSLEGWRRTFDERLTGIRFQIAVVAAIVAGLVSAVVYLIANR